MRVTVTGGDGFLGRYVVQALRRFGEEVFVAHSDEFDLRKEYDCRGLIHSSDPDAVVHLAAAVGGIGDNVENPGKFVYENAVMGLHLMEEARKSLHPCKFLTVGTACMYPADAPVPMREENLFDGAPAQETAPYAHAKRLLLIQSQAYRAQYDFNAVFVIPTNLFGPEDTSNHAVASIIRKVSQAKRDGLDEVTLWGSGEATRDFLYVENAADGIVAALNWYDDPEPLNLGTGVETPVAELAQIIASIYGWEGSFRWDSSLPEGTLRRCLDTSRAHSLGWKSWITLETGLRRTIDWYEEASLADHAVHANT